MKKDEEKKKQKPFKETAIPLANQEKIRQRELERVQSKVKVAVANPDEPVTVQDPARVENSVTIVLGNLPTITKNVLYKKVRKYGTVAEITIADSTNTLRKL